MQNDTQYDVIIVGGSYAGLAAALTLGRSLRRVLVIDSGKACNRQTPHSHNFLTQDGVEPHEIARIAKEQVLRYPTVSFRNDTVNSVNVRSDGFVVGSANGHSERCRQIVFATGVHDEMPDLPGFAECWGISVLHCPYCHGYEVHGGDIGILADGETALELCQLIQHWAGSLTLYTNGPSRLDAEQRSRIESLNIPLVDLEIEGLEHVDGRLSHWRFRDGSSAQPTAVFARTAFRQHSPLPQALGCELTESGHIEVDAFQQTSVSGVFAAGDCATQLRTVSVANSQGTIAGVAVNMELMKKS